MNYERVRAAIEFETRMLESRKAADAARGVCQQMNTMEIVLAAARAFACECRGTGKVSNGADYGYRIYETFEPCQACADARKLLGES